MPSAPPKSARIPTPVPVAVPRFRLTASIGTHPLGGLHWGLDTLTGKRVLLTLYRTLASDEALESCRNTARIAGGLGSTYIPRFVDAIRMGDQTVIAVDPGEVEITVLPRQQPIEPGRAVAILRQVCKAVGAGHDIGLVHRALTMGSVMLTGRGRADAVLVGDFGVSAFVEQVAVGETDAPFQPVSPESAVGLRPSPREDIYLIGVIAYTMLSGGPPFRTGTAEAVRRRHAIEEPTSIEMRMKDGARIPDPLAHVVMRCLAKEPDERFAHVHDLEAELCMAQIEGDLPSGWDDLPLPEVDAERRRHIADGLAEISTRIASAEQLAALGAAAAAAELAAEPDGAPVAMEVASTSEIPLRARARMTAETAEIPTRVSDATEEQAIELEVDAALEDLEEATVVRLAPSSAPTPARAEEPASRPAPPAAPAPAPAAAPAPVAAPAPAPLPAPAVAPRVEERSSVESLAPSISPGSSMSAILDAGISPWPKILVGAAIAVAVVVGVVVAFTGEEEPPAPPPPPPAEPVKPAPPKPEPTILRRTPKPPPEATTKAQKAAVDLAVKGAAVRVEGRPSEAERLFRRALAKDPLNVGALAGIADLCQEKGDRDCALEHLRRANKAYPDDVAMHMRLADLLLEADKLVEARVHFEEALALGDPLAAQRLAALASQERK